MLKSWSTSTGIDKVYFIGLPIIWLVVNWYLLPSAWNAEFSEWTPLMMTTIFTVSLLRDRAKREFWRGHYVELAIYLLFITYCFVEIIN